MSYLDSNGFADRRALLAEGDLAYRLILQVWLQKQGYEVILASNGDQAWTALRSVAVPRLVILDWTMPDIDGIELCRRIRKESQEHDAYVLMTGIQRRDVGVIQALEAGADDFLAKPFENSDLHARLRVARRVLGLQDHLLDEHQRSHPNAQKDALTGLWNRTTFLNLLNQEVKRSERTHDQTGLLLLDVDRLENINNAYGHVAGDLILREIALRLKQKVRAYDLVGRYGGGEFCIALPGCPEVALRSRAEIIRNSVSDLATALLSPSVPVTLSVGATVVGPNQALIAGALAVADLALSKAKASGRDMAVYCPRLWAEIARSSNTTLSPCSQCDSRLSDSCPCPRHSR